MHFISQSIQNNLYTLRALYMLVAMFVSAKLTIVQAADPVPTAKQNPTSQKVKPYFFDFLDRKVLQLDVSHLKLRDMGDSQDDKAPYLKFLFFLESGNDSLLLTHNSLGPLQSEGNLKRHYVDATGKVYKRLVVVENSAEPNDQQSAKTNEQIIVFKQNPEKMTWEKDSKPQVPLHEDTEFNESRATEGEYFEDLKGNKIRKVVVSPLLNLQSEDGTMIEELYFNFLEPEYKLFTMAQLGPIRTWKTLDFFRNDQAAEKAIYFRYKDPNSGKVTIIKQVDGDVDSFILVP